MAIQCHTWLKLIKSS